MSKKKPHIIIVNPDQWRGDVMGHMGNPAALTPNLDRIVKEDAVSFCNTFCQNTVCTPSRCSFMTGLYPHVRGHRTMHHMLHSEHDETNLLRLLRNNDYFVWWGGKNDMVPGQHGFEDHCDIKFQATSEDMQRWGHHPPEIDRNWRGPADGDKFYSFYLGKLDTHGDSIFCDDDWSYVLGALDLIRDYDGEKPLCLYLPLSYPHPPYDVEEPWYSLIDRSALPPRASTPEGWKGKPSLLKGIWERQHLQGWTEDRWSELRATYYGMCSRVDHQFGLVIDALKKKGIYDDSAIFMFADHGDFTGDYGLVEKTQNTFEDCLSRVPLVVKPPAAVACKPRVSNAITELVDFTATVFELSGIDPGYTHFGRSLLPVLSGETDEHRDAAFCEGGRLYGEPQAMELESSSSQVPEGLYWPRVELQSQDDAPYHSKATMCRTKEMKYVRRLYEDDELYDLERDSMELVNLVNDPAYAPQLARLRERMLTWYQETCDIVPRKTDQR